MVQFIPLFSVNKFSFGGTSFNSRIGRSDIQRQYNTGDYNRVSDAFSFADLGISLQQIDNETSLDTAPDQMFLEKVEKNTESMVTASSIVDSLRNNIFPSAVIHQDDNVEDVKLDIDNSVGNMPAPANPLSDHRFGSEYILAWNRQALDTAAKSNLGPTVAARLYSKLAVVQYDSWALFDPNASGAYYNPIKQNSLTELLAEADVSDTSWAMFAKSYDVASDITKDLILNSLRQSVISRGAHQVLVDIQKSMISDVDVLNGLTESANTLLEQQILNISTLSPFSFDFIDEASIELSNEISSVILEYARNDGSNQLGLYADTSGYVPTASIYDPTTSSPALDSEWQPLSGQIALTPHWGKVQTFAVDVDQVLPEAVVRPYLQSGVLNQEYIDEINEVVEFSSTLSPTDKAIAEYWEGGIDTATPPGIWLEALDEIITNNELSIDDTIELNLKATQAMFDASIAVWNTKYHFNSVRPGTSIRQYYAGEQLSDGSLGSDFDSYLPVPPFPDIPSGHSAFSASFNSVLINYFDNNTYGGSVVLADDSSMYNENGFDGIKGVGEDIVLTWDTFSQAAEQAGLSRLYGQIHTRSGDLTGQVIGYQVAATVNSKVDQLLHGSSPSFEPDLPKQILDL